jgi:hypothetical protein
MWKLIIIYTTAHHCVLCWAIWIQSTSFHHISLWIIIPSVSSTYTFPLSFILQLHGPPLWSSGQSSWPQIRRSLVRFPGTKRKKKNSRSGTGSTQPREYNWGATWKNSSGSILESREYDSRDFFFLLFVYSFFFGVGLESPFCQFQAILIKLFISILNSDIICTRRTHTNIHA